MAAYVGNIDAPGSTGNVSYTNVGFQPMAVLFWGTTRTAAGSNDSTLYSGFFGMTDGTTSHVTGMSGAAPTSNVHRMFGDTSCVKMVDSAGVILQEAEIVSLDADGFTLNWTTAGAVGADVNFVAIAGSNLTNVKVGVATITASGATAVTGVGFQPDMMLFNWYEGTAFPQSVADTNTTIGIGLDDNANANGHGVLFRNSIIDAGNSYMSADSSILTLTANNAPLLSGEGQLTAFGADGFTITMASHAGIDLHVGYLAMKGASNFIYDGLAPGATGDQAETGAGFTPELLFVHNVNVDAGVGEGSGAVGYEGSSINIGAADGTRVRAAQYACDVNADGGDFQSTTHIISQATSADTVDAMSTVADSATFSSFDADGATINWDVYATALDPLVFGWMFSGGVAIGTYDNKIIYADGIVTV